MLKVLDHLRGDVSCDDNHITLAELDHLGGDVSCEDNRITLPELDHLRGDLSCDANRITLPELDHLRGDLSCDDNRITLPELETKLKHLNTKKASGYNRISNKSISCFLPLSSYSSATFLSSATVTLWFGNEPGACSFLNQTKRYQTMAVFDPYLSFAIVQR